MKKFLVMFLCTAILFLYLDSSGYAEIDPRFAASRWSQYNFENGGEGANYGANCKKFANLVFSKDFKVVVPGIYHYSDNNSDPLRR